MHPTLAGKTEEEMYCLAPSPKPSETEKWFYKPSLTPKPTFVLLCDGASRFTAIEVYSYLLGKYFCVRVMCGI